MVKIQFYPIDVGSEIIQNESYIQLFGRTDTKNKICVLDKYEPYFYVLVDKRLDKIKREIEELKVDDKERVDIKAEVVEMNYLNSHVKAIKVSINNINYLKRLATEVKEIDGVSKVLENDINLNDKYLFDKKIVPLNLYSVEGEVIERNDLDADFVIMAEKINEVVGESFTKPKILGFDIEVYTEGRKYPREEKDPIIMISFYSKDFEKVITWKKFAGAPEYVEFVRDEAGLIEKFKSVINKYDPDYLVGYFSDGFDLPYISERARKNDVRLMFNNSNIKISKRGNISSARIKGIVHLDVFKFIRNVMANSLRFDNYSLGNVAKELLNKRKIDVDLEAIGLVWDSGHEDIGKYCEYNLHDARLAFELFEKIMINMNEVVRLVGQPIYEVCRSGYSQMVERYLMKKSKEFNEIIPNKPTNNEISMRRMQRYEGAFVVEPKAGLYENVVVLDFHSMYPSIVASYNICKTTLTKDKEGYETPEITIDGEKVKYRFTKRKEGIIPKAIKEIIVRRNRIKVMIREKKEDDATLEARSYALKTIANATYGYFGFFGARWYCRECAESITAFGRMYVKELIEKAKENGFKVIYGDTDAIFITLGDKREEDIKKFLENVNKGLPGLMELELENIYKRGIFVSKKDEKQGAKKKYALINKDGKIKVRGFETIRRDWSLLAKEVQKNVLNLVLKENNPKQAYKYVREVIEDVRRGNFDVKKMIIKTKLVREIESYELVGPHVVIAKKMRELGISTSVGTIISYVVTSGKGRIRDKAMLPEEAKDYDADYYINNQIIPVVERIFDVLGYRKEDLGYGKIQSKLGDFGG